MDEPVTQPEAAVEANQAENAWPVLSRIQVRVLGCLMEKANTTPEYYPLTLNSLTTACNQKSNRDPLMSLSEADVMDALDGLRHTHRLVALVHTSGSRVEKYKHTISQVIELNPRQAAILCELLLRGPETVGELRTRASRLHPFSDLNEVQAILDELASHAGGALVVRLPREPGRRESRWMHVLAGVPEAASADEPDEIRLPTAKGDVDALREEIGQIKAELESLRAEFARFRQQFE